MLAVSNPEEGEGTSIKVPMAALDAEEPSPDKNLVLTPEVLPLNEMVIVGPDTLSRHLAEYNTLRSVKVCGIEENETEVLEEPRVTAEINSNVFAIMPPRFRKG